MRHACASVGKGRLRYVADKAGCAAGEEALHFTIPAGHPLYACVSLKARTDDEEGRRFPIPAGATWTASGPDRCNQERQALVVLGGKHAVSFCASTAEAGMLRHIPAGGACHKGELAVYVSGRGGGHEPLGRHCHRRGHHKHGTTTTTTTTSSQSTSTSTSTSTTTTSTQQEQPNHAPTLTVPGPQALHENATLEFSAPGADALGVQDPDSGGGVERLTLSVSDGALQPGGGVEPLATSSGAGTGTLTLEGTILALNEALEGLEYAPVEDFHGSDALRLEADDLGHTGAGGAMSASASVAIVVEQVDQSPMSTVPFLEQEIAENGSLLFDSLHTNAISIEDADSEGGVERAMLAVEQGTLSPGATASLESVTGEGTASLTLEGTIAALNEALEGLEYQPAHDYHGADALTLEADDLGHTGLEGPKTTTSEVPISVTPVVYDEAVADEYSTEEDQTLAVSAPGVLANDTDSDSPPLPLEAEEVSGPAHGSLALNADGSFTYTPDHLYVGTDSFTYVDQDKNTASNEATVTIEVEGRTFDQAANDSYATVEGQKLEVSSPGVLGNDTDSEGLSLEAELVSGPSHGILSLRPDGSFSYEPSAEYSGQDSFVYRDNDGNSGVEEGHSNDATVTIEVEHVDQAPSNTVPGDQSVAENGSLAFASGGGNAISVEDVDSEGEVERSKLSVDHGTLSPGATGSLASVSGSGSATLTIEGTIPALNEALQGLEYAPAHDYQGGDSLTVETDDLGHTGLEGPKATTSHVPLAVTPVVYDEAVADEYSTEEDEALEVSAPGVLANDTDSDSPPLPLEAEEVSGPAHGTLTLHPDGSFEYTPEHLYSGEDSFSYRDKDGNTQSPPTTVTIHVEQAAFDHAANDRYSTREGEALEVSAPGVLSNDSDSEGLSLEAEEVSGPSHGSLSLNPDGSFSYEPEPGYSGEDSFVYRDNDGNTASNGATVTIEVEHIDRAPENTVPGDQSVAENGSLAFSSGGGNAISVEDVDSEGGVERVSAEAAHGALTPGETASLASVTGSGTGTLTLEGTIEALNEALEGLEYAPSHNYYGSDALNLETDDLGHTGLEGPKTDVSEVPIEVTPVVYDEAIDDEYTVTEETKLEVGAPGVLANDVDSDSPPLPLEVEELNAPSHGTLLLNADGSFSYEPNTGFVGEDSFSYTDSDGNTLSNEATVTLKVVEHENEAPTLALPGSQEVQEATSGSPQSLVFSTAEGNAVSIADADSHGRVERIELSVGHGKLDLGTTAGLTASSGDETASATIEGTIASLNEALEGLRYEPEVDYSGPDALSLAADDLGHSGHGGAKTATGEVAIEVVHPPPAPTNPTYSGAIGNTEFTVGVSEPSAPDVERSGSLLPSPAEEPDGSAVSIAAETIATAHGGAVVVKEDGTFAYTPPAGFENGGDTFQYTEKDTRGGEATGMATVEFDNARVWYVNDNAATNGNGESSTPFNALGSLAGAGTGSGDYVFLYGGGPTYTGGVELKAKQTLEGQDEGLTVEGEALVSPEGSEPTITNSAGAGIKIAEGDAVRGVKVSGTSGAGVTGSAVNAFTLDSRVSISGASGDGLEVSGGNGTITDEANIVNSSANAHSVAISNRTGGTVTVSGAIEDTGGGILLSSNSGATVAFSGRLTLSTGAHEAFAATGGGTVTAINAESTAATTTGTALDVEETTIGAAGLKFKSVSAGTSASGPSRGIALVKTGSSGGLDVTGNGTAGSGGTIEHTTASGSASLGGSSGGIYLKEASDISLNDMDIASNAANGVYGTQVSGLTIAHDSVTENGDAEGVDDSGLRVDGLAGTSSIASSTFSGSPYDNAMITSESSGSLTLDVEHSTFGPKKAEIADDGLMVEARGTAAVTLEVTEEDSFTGNYANGLETRDTSSATMHVAAEHDSFTNNTGAGADVSSESGGEADFTISDDTLTGQQGNAINVFAHGSGRMLGYVTGNQVGAEATPGSGSKAGSGIALTSTGSETMTTEVAENKVVQIQSENGINATANQGSAALDLTLKKNEVHTDQASSLDGITLDSGAATADTSTLCVNATENTAVSSGTEAGNHTYNTYGLVAVNNTPAAVFQIQGYTGSSTSDSEVETYLHSRNTRLEGTEGSVLAEFNSKGFTAATCPTVPWLP